MPAQGREELHCRRRAAGCSREALAPRVAVLSCRHAHRVEDGAGSEDELLERGAVGSDEVDLPLKYDRPFAESQGFEAGEVQIVGLPHGIHAPVSIAMER